jgi:hypothetical protein
LNNHPEPQLSNFPSRKTRPTFNLFVITEHVKPIYTNILERRPYTSWRGR